MDKAALMTRLKNPSNKAFAIVLVSLLIGCTSKKDLTFKIVGANLDGSGGATYTIYASDTDRAAMQVMVDSLLEGKIGYSSVGFFFPESKTPKVKSNHAITPGDYLKYMIALAKYDTTSNRFEVIITNKWIKENKEFMHSKN